MNIRKKTQVLHDQFMTLSVMVNGIYKKDQNGG